MHGFKSSGQLGDWDTAPKSKLLKMAHWHGLEVQVAAQSVTAISTHPPVMMQPLQEPPPHPSPSKGEQGEGTSMRSESPAVLGPDEGAVS